MAVKSGTSRETRHRDSCLARLSNIDQPVGYMTYAVQRQPFSVIICHQSSGKWSTVHIFSEQGFDHGQQIWGRIWTTGGPAPFPQRLGRDSRVRDKFSPHPKASASGAWSGRHVALLIGSIDLRSRLASLEFD